MGHRAYILDEQKDNTWNLYYTHWGATLTHLEGKRKPGDRIPFPLNTADFPQKIESSLEESNLSFQAALMDSLGQEAVWIRWKGGDYHTYIPIRSIWGFMVVQNIVVPSFLSLEWNAMRYEGHKRLRLWIESWNTNVDDYNKPQMAMHELMKKAITQYGMYVADRYAILITTDTYGEANTIHHWENARYEESGQKEEKQFVWPDVRKPNRTPKEDYTLENICQLIQEELERRITVQVKKTMESYVDNGLSIELIPDFSPVHFEYSEPYDVGILNHENIMEREIPRGRLTLPNINSFPSLYSLVDKAFQELKSSAETDAD